MLKFTLDLDPDPPKVKRILTPAYDLFYLQVCCSQLKLKQLHHKQMGGGGGGGMDQSGLSNSMMGGGLGGGASNLGGQLISLIFAR